MAGCGSYKRKFSWPVVTHCILVDSSTVICWTSLFVILGVIGLFCSFYSILMEILLANKLGLDQMSDLELPCLSMAFYDFLMD